MSCSLWFCIVNAHKDVGHLWLAYISSPNFQWILRNKSDVMSKCSVRMCLKYPFSMGTLVWKVSQILTHPIAIVILIENIDHQRIGPIIPWNLPISDRHYDIVVNVWTIPVSRKPRKELYSPIVNPFPLQSNI